MKTLNELANELRDFIIDLQSDAHNKARIRLERYNNLKLIMDISANPTPHVKVSLSMSDADFSLKTREKINGGLGPDEKYVIRWLEKPDIVSDLQACWGAVEKNTGKATDANV
jgi:hypothetical protein